MSLTDIVNDIGELEDVVIPMIKAGNSRAAIRDVDRTRWSHQYGIEDINGAIDVIYNANERFWNFNNENSFNKIQAEVDSQYRVIHNQVHDKRYMKLRGGDEWTDYDDLPILHHLKAIKGFGVVKDRDLDAIVHHLAVSVNPIKQYFEELPVWNTKTDYIKKFCECFDTQDDEFFYQMLTKNLVRTIKCALESDYENRYLFIFVGGQQSGKTKAVQFLNPFYEDNGYGKYHSHAPIKMGEKDAIIQSSKVFIWNVEEFEMMKGKEMSFFKGIISQGNTSIRPAYSKHERPVTRRCTYMASTNRDEFLSDNENTRYLCIRLSNDKTHQIKWKQYLKMGVDKIWQQAYALYLDKNFDYELNSDEKQWQERINKGHSVTTFVSEILEDIYRKPENGDEVQYLSLVDIKRDVSFILDNKFDGNVYHIKDAMLAMGIEYKQYWNETSNGKKNIGKKYAVVRLKEGDSDFLPSPDNVGTWKQ